MKKLYHVEASVTFSMAVYAKDESDALATALANAQDEFENGGDEFDVFVIPGPVPSELHETIPYGSEDDHGDATVAEILAKEPQS